MWLTTTPNSRVRFQNKLIRHRRNCTDIMSPDWQPTYNKPDAPGIAMNFDNSVSIYHVVSGLDSFEEAAGVSFELIREAQRRFPGWPRVFYLDIEGHDGGRDGFDEDFFEFQQELFFATMAPFLTAFELPLTGGLVNPAAQRDDLPDELVIDPPASGTTSS